MRRHAGLSTWQLAFLALGTVIGGSFFVGSAIPIRVAGPASLLAFILAGALVYVILSALSEMTVADPAPGSFRSHAANTLGPMAAFVVGWAYWAGLALAMSSEAAAVAFFLQRWLPLSVPLIAAIVVAAVTLLNLLGARRLATLESGLAAVKLLAIAGFIALSFALLTGVGLTKTPIGLGALRREALFPGGATGIAGSMLIVMFAYAGFEVIGLASSEARNPHRTVPRAISLTILLLVGLYTLSVALLLPLVKTSTLTEGVSPFVDALNRHGLSWAGGGMTLVMITAILSTMLAAMFGLGRMVRSLADEGQAPGWLRDGRDVPGRGILFSGMAMLAGIGMSLVLPQRIYLFLVSSGGFALLFAYLIILMAHFRFRKKHGCPPRGKCQLAAFPFSSIISQIALIAVMASMPLVPGQGAGLAAGSTLVAFFGLVYLAVPGLRRPSGSRRLMEVPVQIADFEAAEEHANPGEDSGAMGTDWELDKR